MGSTVPAAIRPSPPLPPLFIRDLWESSEPCLTQPAQIWPAWPWAPSSYTSEAHDVSPLLVSLITQYFLTERDRVLSLEGDLPHDLWIPHVMIDTVSVFAMTITHGTWCSVLTIPGWLVDMQTAQKT